MFDTLDRNMQMREDYTGKYLWGVVHNNVDPLGLDRIQVHVPNLYEPDQGEVPWIGPFKVSPFGIGSSWGVYGSPARGSDVLILLQDGNSHYPAYVAGIQRRANLDFNSGTSWGFVDPLGNKLHFDLESGTVTFRAHSGVSFIITPSGGVHLTTADAVVANAPSFQFNGDVDIAGALRNNGVDVGSNHAHVSVKTGSDVSGKPVQ